MNSKTIYIILIVLFTSLFSNAQIKLDSNNKVGLRTSSPSYEIDMLGSTRIKPSSGSNYSILISTDATHGWKLNPSSNYTGMIGYYDMIYSLNAEYLYGVHVTESDKNLKKNIQPLYDALPIINKLKPVSFDYDIDYSGVEETNVRTKLEATDKNRLGFIAQEVREILPQSILTKEPDSTLGIRMDDFIPLLVKGMQEQSARIDSLVSVIEKLKSSQGSLKVAQITGVEGEIKTGTKLFQNAPNPFSERTSIRFEIPTTIQNAQLQIYNMNGTLLKSIFVNQRGEGNVTINANEFSAGMYLYSLITDGKIVDTKQMLLTE